MGIDSMRVGGGRCPPLLVGGLLVVCLMLIVNWYSLSSENLELLHQMDELGEQLKMSAEERDQCVTLRGNQEQRLKKSDDEIASLHVRLTQQFELKRQKADVEMSLTACKTELASLREVDKTRSATIEALRLDKERTSTQLDEKREENKKLQEELEKMKSELETAKAAINAPNEKKEVEILPKATGRILDKGQLGLVSESAVRIAQPGLRGMKFHGVPILPQDPPGAVRQIPRFSVTMMHGNKDENLSSQIKQTQKNMKIKNTIDNGAEQDLQEDEDQTKDQMNNFGHNPLEDIGDGAEHNNVEDEEKDQQKLATNEHEKQ